VWPIAGYWSEKDTDAPTECNYPEACPGFVLEYSNNSPVGVSTAVCSDGYESDVCSTCSVGLYFKDGFRCGICGDAAVAISPTAALVIGILIFSTMGLFVAFLPAHRLVQSVQVFLGLQWAALMMAIGTPFIDAPAWAVDIIEVVGVTYIHPRLSLVLTWPKTQSCQPILRLVESLTLSQTTYIV
jgi:hypothetical protein